MGAEDFGLSGGLEGQLAFLAAAAVAMVDVGVSKTEHETQHYSVKGPRGEERREKREGKRRTK
jgi:hypothetical protein